MLVQQVAERRSVRPRHRHSQQHAAILSGALTPRPGSDQYIRRTRTRRLQATKVRQINRPDRGKSARSLLHYRESPGIDADDPVCDRMAEESLARIEAENQRFLTLNLNLDLNTAVE